MQEVFCVLGLFSDKNVMITGCSRGIGKQIAEDFAAEGAVIIGCEVEEHYQDLLAGLNDIEAKHSVTTFGCIMDLLDTKSIKDVVDKVVVKFGHIDILVNNAGINILASVLDTDEEVWDKVVNTNLKGTFYVTREVLKNMITNQYGRIISIASQHAVVGNYKRAAYCASKAGIVNMSKVVALENADHGITANCVSPTFVESEVNGEVLYSRSFIKDALEKIPVGRYASTKDVSSAVLFLAGDKGMITGQNLLVDGGWTIH